MQSLCRMHIASDASYSTAKKVNQVCASNRRSCNSTHYPEQQVHHNKTVSFRRQREENPPQKVLTVCYILDLQENFLLSLFVKSIRKWTKCTAMLALSKAGNGAPPEPIVFLGAAIKMSPWWQSRGNLEYRELSGHSWALSILVHPLWGAPPTHTHTCTPTHLTNE